MLASASYESSSDAGGDASAPFHHRRGPRVCAEMSSAVPPPPPCRCATDMAGVDSGKETVLCRTRVARETSALRPVRHANNSRDLGGAHMSLLKPSSENRQG